MLTSFIWQCCYHKYRKLVNRIVVKVDSISNLSNQFLVPDGLLASKNDQIWSNRNCNFQTPIFYHLCKTESRFILYFRHSQTPIRMRNVYLMTCFFFGYFHLIIDHQLCFSIIIIDISSCDRKMKLSRPVINTVKHFVPVNYLKVREKLVKLLKL